MSGTDLRYAPISVDCDLQCAATIATNLRVASSTVQAPILLRAPVRYAMPGTDLAYDATRVLVPSMVPWARIIWTTSSGRSRLQSTSAVSTGTPSLLSSYALPMQCLVLIFNSGTNLSSYPLSIYTHMQCPVLRAAARCLGLKYKPRHRDECTSLVASYTTTMESPAPTTQRGIFAAEKRPRLPYPRTGLLSSYAMSCTEQLYGASFAY
eukprot:1511953-Rhodomonas_salina.1